MPATPSFKITGILVKALEEIGAHAVRGTRKTPYMMEQTEIRLEEMAVAMGAPMKPNPNGFGPHTVQWLPVQSVSVAGLDQNRGVPKR